MTTAEDRLFDPRDYGGKLEEPRQRKRPEGHTVVVSPPWVVLQRLKSSPVAHVTRIPDDPKFAAEVRALGTLMGRCEVFGTPMGEMEGRTAPACPKCIEIVAKDRVKADEELARRNGYKPKRKRA